MPEDKKISELNDGTFNTGGMFPYEVTGVNFNITMLELMSSGVPYVLQNGGNIRIGTNAAPSWSSLTNTIALGDDSAAVLTSGGDNVFIGENTALTMTNGSFNTFIGDEAGRNTTSCSYTVLIGRNTGGAYSVGDDCILIGNWAVPADSGENNCIVIGSNAVGAGPNSMVLGNTSITDTYIRGYSHFTPTSSRVGINIGSYDGEPDTLSDGDIWYNGSTSRLTVREDSTTKTFFFNEEILPVSSGGTGGSSVYAARRAMMLGMVRVITAGSAWSAGSISGTTTQGTESTNFYAFSQISAGTAGKSRIYSNISSSGPLWPGSQGAPDFSRKVIVNLNALVRLSAHSDSRVSIHFTLTNVSTHTSHDRNEKGISILFRGGASAGTVEIQTHDGSSATSSSTGTFAINSQEGHPFTLEWEPGVAVRLYKGSSLLCQKTTNLPSGTSGASQQGICVITENTTNGTGNATLFRWIDCYLTEIP